MNTTDHVLRAAARQARVQFPPDGELPPLNLPELTASAGGARGRRGARGGARLIAIGPRRVWLAPVAAAAAVGIVVSGIVALQGSASREQHHKPAGDRTSGQAAAARQREQRQRQALDTLVVKAFAPATGPQYDQGTRLMWLVHARELRATATCMASSGYHISGASAPFSLATYADNTQWPDLPRIARTHAFVPLGGVTVPSYSKAEQHALTACNARAAAPYQQLFRLGQAISSRWLTITSRIQGSARVRAALPALAACAARYGYPGDPYGNATGPIRSFSDFMDWVAGFLDGAGSRGASNATMRALSRHWTTVFVTCARPIVGLWQPMQVAAQRQFLREHAGQFSRLDQVAWQLLGRQH